MTTMERLRASAQLERAVYDALDALHAFVVGEVCDHDAAICYCGANRALDDLALAAGLTWTDPQPRNGVVDLLVTDAVDRERERINDRFADERDDDDEEVVEEEVVDP